MMINTEQRRRVERVGQWFGPGRFGLFYHWGLYTGGGDTAANPARNWPLHYGTIEDLERAVPDPSIVARNMVANATRVGARYITLTVVHSCDAFCVIYPTRLPGFRMKTRLDYLGEFIRHCDDAGIKPVLYFPAGPGEHWNTPGGPSLDEGFRDDATFAELLARMISELAGLHGNKIGGFWMDGNTNHSCRLPEFTHNLLPDAVFIINNGTRLDTPGMDVGTTEFLNGPADPAYCRPSGLVRPNPRWKGILAPKKDFNEDIPTCNAWWYNAGPEHCTPTRWAEVREMAKPYVDDPTFFVRQMVSSLGQRGQWNYALGIGPRVDGSIPPEFDPSFDTMNRFMAWAHESIYNTTGGEGSALAPGWCYADGFCSVTVSLTNPSIHYIHVTTAPQAPELVIQCNGYDATAVTDLRTGAPLAFNNCGCLQVTPPDWSDVATYGDKVLKVQF